MLSRIRPFFTIISAMLIMLASSTVALIILERQQLEQETGQKLVMLHHNFQRQVLDETSHMSSLLTFIAEDKNIQREWQNGDIDALLRQTMPIFHRIQAQHSITHFYFIALDRTCVLRVHNPSTRGDYIDRTTLDMAVHLNRPTYGLELGPLGTFALRVIHPWIVNGRLIGYLELAEDVSHLSSQVASLMNINIICLTGKDKLDRSKWEVGQRMLARKADWDQFREVVMLYSDIENIPAKLTHIIDSTRPSNKVFSISINGHYYMGGIDQLSDADGNYVARLVMLTDTTSATKDLLQLIGKLFIFTLAVTALLIVIKSRMIMKHSSPD